MIALDTNTCNTCHTYHYQCECSKDLIIKDDLAMDVILYMERPMSLQIGYWTRLAMSRIVNDTSNNYGS